MTADILKFIGVSLLDSDPDRVLDEWKGRLQGFVLCGWNQDGEMIYASTYADGGTALWLLEKMKKALLEVEVE